MDPYAPPQADLGAGPPPGGVAPGLRLANPWKRLGAKLADQFFYLLTALPVFGGLLIGASTHEDAVFESPVFWVGAALSALLSLGLFVVTVRMWLSSGQSPGKFVTGLRIVRADGSQADFEDLVIKRWGVPMAITVALSCLGIQVLFTLPDSLFVFSATRQTLHDRIAGTVVIEVDPGNPFP